MNCPRCKGECKTSWYEGVCIDTCVRCEGSWLDEGELAAIKASREKTFTRAEIDAIRGVTDKVVVGKEALASELACPKCEGPMERYNYAGASGVVLDKCCAHGIWFDKGELEAVQILVEQWEKKAGEDKAQFSPILDKASKEQRERMRAANPSKWFSSSPIVNFVIELFS